MEYDQKARIGQAINMAHSWIMKTSDMKTMTMTVYEKELQEKTIIFLSMITKIQSSYETALKTVELPKKDNLSNKFKEL